MEPRSTPFQAGLLVTKPSKLLASCEGIGSAAILVRGSQRSFKSKLVGVMGIDIEAGGRKKVKKRVVKSENPYLRLLCQLYKFLARRSESKFNKVIYKRLNMSGRNRPPLSLSKLIKNMEGKDGKIAVCVGKVD